MAATSDIHWPQYQGLFIKSLRQLPVKLDLMLIAGDLVNRGGYRGIASLTQKLLEENITCPVVACFGNDDYDSIKGALRDTARDAIIFLDDEMTTLTIRGEDVAIVGSRGVLDQPTYWQARNVKGIRDIYTKRVATLDKLLAKAKAQTLQTILLTHYTCTFKTLKGETQRAYAQMGSKRVEELLIKHEPMLAIHGHAHRGIRKVMVNKVPVFNVAIPLNRNIVQLKTPIKGF
ncbi:MAG: metallophosphoesterase [Candidatus Hermodarchaeota archaeon]|nr:metallophosphoesterase [Candidatus Hermodarchaeota archaeon]